MSQSTSEHAIPRHSNILADAHPCHCGQSAQTATCTLCFGTGPDSDHLRRSRLSSTSGFGGPGGTRKSTFTAWLGFIVGVGVSLAANVAAADPTALARC